MPLAGGIIVFINLLIYFLFEYLDLFGDKVKFFLGCSNISSRYNR